MNYKAFISYRHSENGRRHAIALETALKRYAKPVLTSPMKIFRDEKHMKPDMSLPKLIQDGLKSSEYLIFLAEKASADSPWCSEELEYWCNPRKLNRAQNLIIVLIGDDIILNTTRSVNFERSTALPPVLRTYLTSIPLYIDLRWATTGTDTDLQHPRYRHEINGLSARLRGVNPEDLNDEEIRVHRRNMRLKNWTLAILLVLLFSALGAAYWANKQQKVAEKESIENYANDLAYKSQTLLAQGERMDAFVLAELAHQYVAVDNNKVTKALFDAFYHNDNVDNQILPWSYKLSGHSFGVFSVAFSPDGKFLGTGSGDNTAKVWSLATGYAVFTFKGHTDVVTAVAFSPDGKRFASSSKDNTVKIWDLRSGKQMHTFAGHSGIVTSIAFSPDGKKLASASEDKSVKMWSLETGSIVHSFEGHTGSVTCVAFSPNGSNLTSGSDDKTIRIWDMNGGQDPLVLNAHREGVKCIAYSKDGKYIASGSADKTAKVWDVHNATLVNTIEGHAEQISSIAFSPDGKRLATASLDGTAKIWQLPDYQLLFALEGTVRRVWSVAFSPDGKCLATGSESFFGGQSFAKIWDLTTGKSALTLQGHKDHVTSLVFSHNGKKLVTGSWDDTAIIWDLNNNKIIRTIKSSAVDKESSGSVNCVAVSPDDKIVAVGYASTIIKIWDWASGKVLFSLTGHENPVSSADFSPDGKYLVTGSGDNTAKVWDLSSKKTLQTLKGHTDPVASVAFSPDGKRVATGSFDNTAKIWDWQGGKELFTLNGHSGPIQAVAFSPDGKYIATGSFDSKVKIWDSDNRKPLFTFDGPTVAVNSVAFSPDGKQLAIGSLDNSAIIWDFTLGKVVLTLKGHTGPVFSVAFSPDGKRLATGAWDNTVKIWEIDPRVIIEKQHKQRRSADYSLSETELEKYGLDNLLDVRTENEQLLIKSGKTWQIAAFAEMYNRKVMQSAYNRKKHYERAIRLFQACLSSNIDNTYFKRKITNLKAVAKMENY